MTYQDISAKQAYEWTKTNHWSQYQFVEWLNEKGIKHNEALYTPGGTLIHHANGELQYEWITTARCNFKQFQKWMNSFL